MARQQIAADSSRLRRLGFGALALVFVGLGAAGCTNDGRPPLAAARGPTIAFESIDGLPEGLFRKLVQALSAESDARQLAVVSREGPAQYRVRGYAAAHVHAKRTTIAWVWDVYDADQQRALRISGEEQASSGGRRGWTAADDQTVRRIARESLDQLSAYFAVPAAAPPPPEPRDNVYAVAARDDFSAESSGIYRFFRGLAPAPANAAPSAAEAAPENAAAEPVPLPKRRPRNAGLTTQAALAE